MRRRKADIAVIGMSCRFPGADGYQQFWANLENGVNSIREITPDRWSIDEYYSPDPEKPGKSISKWCGLLDHIYDFDNQFFQISPREAANMDPQQRLLLEETWRCIEDSGVPIRKLQQKTTSVYVGVMTTDYRQHLASPEQMPDSYACLGNYESILANRISYWFDFHGISKPVNAACASSLVAIHEAKQALMRGDCDYALIACVNTNLHPLKYISFSKSRMLSPDGQCKTFDIDANGYVPGDGVGVLLLQRLEEAVQNGIVVHGLIKGTAVNHSGKSISITAPSIQAQQEVILSAYRDADINPETVTYVEAHGTGTSLGDPIEIEALTRAFREYTYRNQFCRIGSVKTNIGHLEGAAGIAGIIKVLLMMKHKKIPATLNLNTLNPIISFEDTPFLVSGNCEDWKSGESDGLSLRAGVSSFGFGGVNSHVLLEEYVPDEKEEPELEEQPELFLLSAKNPASLERMIGEWMDLLQHDTRPPFRLRDICLTMQTGRAAFPYRYGRLVKNREELMMAVQSAAQFPTHVKVGITAWGLHIGEFSWKGYSDIESLVSSSPIYRRHLEDGMKMLKAIRVSKSIRDGLYEENWEGPHGSIYLFISGYAYVITLMELGLKPDQVSAQKSGIWIAMAITGMMSMKDILTVISKKTKPGNDFLARPAIPFYDCLRDMTYPSFLIQEEYVVELLNSMNGQTLTVISEYVYKARLLYESQYTFKKTLDDWIELVQSTCGLRMRHWLYDNDLLNEASNLYEIEKKILLISIVYSIRKLNQKWDIQEQRIIGDLRFYELIDLLMDGVITKEVITELVSNTIPDFSLAAKKLQQNAGKLNPARSYSLLRQYNSRLQEIPEMNEWIEAAEDTVRAVSKIRKNSFVLGKTEWNAEGQMGHIALSSDGDLKTCFQENLLRLWLNGNDISWELLNRNEKYQSLHLPTYSFQRETFQLASPRRIVSKQVVDSVKPMPDDDQLKQLLTKLGAGEIEVEEIKSLMGDT
ncbi:type I polyketide synthase [Paenibacillus sp. NPDC057934]|uniref:type I polyketide synthase n=1 Tax=Paenibacillus sp. NPDC057934 TaxID=3346282 RepID=UPI0036DB189F